jgi:TorA maturation chaperone TorD
MRTSGGAVDDVDVARARVYALLATLLLAAPDQALLDRIAGLPADMETPLGRAHSALAAAARETGAAAVGREYFDLFVGVGRGEILPYASFYRTGFLNSRPLADLRRDLDRIGVERDPNRHEPEDHLGTVLEVMAGLVDGTFDGGDEAAFGFYIQHLQPWAARVFADMAAAPSARFYRAVGEVGRVWLDIETEAANFDT